MSFNNCNSPQYTQSGMTCPQWCQMLSMAPLACKMDPNSDDCTKGMAHLCQDCIPAQFQQQFECPSTPPTSTPASMHSPRSSSTQMMHNSHTRDPSRRNQSIGSHNMHNMHKTHNMASGRSQSTSHMIQHDPLHYVSNDQSQHYQNPFDSQEHPVGGAGPYVCTIV